MAADRNVEFLVQCTRKIPAINFVERASGLVYARMESGKMVWVDREALQRVVGANEAQAALAAMAPRLIDDLEQITPQAAKPVPEDALRHTLGDMS